MLKNRFYVDNCKYKVSGIMYQEMKNKILFVVVLMPDTRFAILFCVHNSADFSFSSHIFSLVIKSNFVVNKNIWH